MARPVDRRRHAGAHLCTYHVDYRQSRSKGLAEEPDPPRHQRCAQDDQRNTGQLELDEKPDAVHLLFRYRRHLAAPKRGSPRQELARRIDGQQAYDRENGVLAMNGAL